MDAQTIWSAALVVPAVVLAVIAIPARRRGVTTFGIGLRDGAVLELLRGMLFSIPFLAALLLVLASTGLVRVAWDPAGLPEAAGVAVYFFVLFLVEELVFRGLLMTGIGVLLGQVAALLVTAVLVAGAYLFAPHTGVLAMVGAVVTNVLHGWARWRSGRIWWGLGQRWVWNAGVVSFGLADSGFSLHTAPLLHDLAGPAWLTGGAFGLEAGVIGIAFLLVMLALSTRFARGRHGPWTIDRATRR